MKSFNLRQKFLLVILNIGYSQQTILTNHSCKNTAQELSIGTSWILSSPKEAPYPRVCQWDFSIKEEESVSVEIVRNGNDLWNISDPCITFQENDTGVFHIQSEVVKDQSLCFHGILNISFFARRCPFSDPWNALKITVKRQTDGSIQCLKHQLMKYNCFNNHVNLTTYNDAIKCEVDSEGMFTTQLLSTRSWLSDNENYLTQAPEQHHTNGDMMAESSQEKVFPQYAIVLVALCGLLVVLVGVGIIIIGINTLNRNKQNTSNHATCQLVRNPLYRSNRNDPTTPMFTNMKQETKEKNSAIESNSSENEYEDMPAEPYQSLNKDTKEYLSLYTPLNNIAAEDS